MTPALALAIAVQCVGPVLAPIAVGIGKHESGLVETATHHNTDNTTDHGLGMINQSNFPWLSKLLGTPVNETTVMDPCLNFRASIAVLFAKYNGNPPDLVKAAYAADVVAKIATVPPAQGQPQADDPVSSEQRGEDLADPQPPSWDMEAVAGWRSRHVPSPEEVAEATATEQPVMVEIIRKDKRHE